MLGFNGSLCKPFCTMLFPIILLALTACQQNTTPPTAPPLLPVQIAHPLRAEIREWDEYIGRFEAVNRVEIRARVGGYIEKVNFQDGQFVNKGRVLFVIDPQPFKIALDQAKAELGQTQAERDQAQSNFDRVESLKGSRAISEEEYDQRLQALNAAGASVKAAESRVASAALELSWTNVRAPINGRVSRDFVNIGNLISGGSANATLLTTMVSLDPIHFYFEGSETDLLKYTRLAQEGNRASSRNKANPVLVSLLDEEEFKHEGRMDFVDNEIDLETGTIEGRAVFDNPGYTIEPGMFGRARLLAREKHEVILVPDAVIGTDQSRKFVYTLSDSNTVSIRPIELGPLQDHDMRIIRNGLTVKDKIITNNIARIRPGMKIQPKEVALENPFTSPTNDQTSD